MNAVNTKSYTYTLTHWHKVAELNKAQLMLELPVDIATTAGP
jgi:hypothetical protein